MRLQEILPRQIRMNYTTVYVGLTHQNNMKDRKLADPVHSAGRNGRIAYIKRGVASSWRRCLVGAVGPHRSTPIDELKARVRTNDL